MHAPASAKRNSKEEWVSVQLLCNWVWRRCRKLVSIVITIVVVEEGGTC